MNRLLLENKEYDQLHSNLDSWQFELDIRRKQYDNLPQGPVSARELVRNEFPFSHTIDCFCSPDEPLYFRDLDGKKVPFPILQVSFLQDIASNVEKYGGSRAQVVVSKAAIAVSNTVVGNPKIAGSTNTGLKALKAMGDEFRMPFTVMRDSTTFTASIQVSCSRAAASTPGDVGGPDPDADPPCNDRFTWILVEDSKVLCELTVRQFERNNIELHAVSRPSDVFNLAAIIHDAWATTQRPVIVIFDENVFSLDDTLETVPETGTNIRHRLLAHPRLHDLVSKKYLFFASVSASVVTDDVVLCTLSKSMAPKALIQHISRAATDATSSDSSSSGETPRFRRRHTTS